MFAVGKKKRPAVGLIACDPDTLRDRRRPRAIRIHALYRTLGVRRVDDYTLASPTASASRQSSGEHLWRAPRNRHFLQLAVGEKSDISAVGRPERIARALRARQNRDVRGTDPLHIEHGQRRVFFRRDKHQHRAVVGKRHVADAHFIRNRQRELHAGCGVRSPCYRPRHCRNRRERQCCPHSEDYPSQQRDCGSCCDGSCRSARVGSRERAQRERQVASRLEALFRILLQATPHNALERWRHHLSSTRQLRRLVLQDRGHSLRRSVAPEGAHPG